MSEAPLLVFVTTITPDPENRGGPSGLPWEMIQELKRAGWDVRIQLISISTNRVRRWLMQLAVSFRYIKLEIQSAEVYVAYPFYIGRLIPPEVRSRTIVLGPDASSLLYARFARIESGWRSWRSRCLAHWFAFQERWVAKHLAGMAVVGRNDKRWLRQVIGPSVSQIIYIPHPVLRTVVKPNLSKNRLLLSRLVFAGDLSRKYVGDFFKTLDFVAISQTLKAADCEVLVVGKCNRYVYNSIADYLPSSYVEWVDDYSTLCDPLRDLHVIPLMAGAGTKNRTLTAAAMNVIIISTPIGRENIDFEVLKVASVYKFRSSMDFLQALRSALVDLSLRRSQNMVLLRPPIELITEAFNEATIFMAKAINASSKK